MSEILKGNQVFYGRYSSLSVDGEELAEVTAVTAVLKASKETVVRTGTMVDASQITGLSGTGTMTWHKINSKMLKKVAGAIAGGGAWPSMSLISTMENKSTGKMEKVALYGVMFDEITLVDWDASKLVSRQTPFTFEDYDLLTLAE